MDQKSNKKFLNFAGVLNLDYIMITMETSFEYLHYYHLQCNVHIRCCNLLVQTRFSPSVSKWDVIQFTFLLKIQKSTMIDGEAS